MKADLSQSTLPPSGRKNWIKLASSVAAILLGVVVVWRLVAVTRDSMAKLDAFMETAQPAAKQFIEGMSQRQWAKASDACAAELKAKLTPEAWKKLLTEHPALADRATPLGFQFDGGFWLSFASFFGAEKGLPNTHFHFNYRLAKPGQADGPILNLLVEFEDGQARITRIMLGDETLPER